VPELDENAEKLQFLHEVSTNVGRFFICRHRTCGYYSYNTNWVQTENLSRYMCPMCGNPWRGRDQPGYIKAQHIWVWAAGGDDPKKHVRLLAEWPHTAGENWITQVMELKAGLREEDRELSEQGIVQRLVAIVGRCQNIWGFEDMELTPWLRQHVREQNMKKSKDKSWTYEHLEGGFLGTKLENPEEAEKTVLRGPELEEFISLVGLYRDRQAGRIKG